MFWYRKPLLIYNGASLKVGILEIFYLFWKACSHFQSQKNLCGWRFLELGLKQIEICTSSQSYTKRALQQLWMNTRIKLPGVSNSWNSDASLSYWACLLWCEWNWFRWKYLSGKFVLSLFKYSSRFFLLIDKNLLSLADVFHLSFGHSFGDYTIHINRIAPVYN